MKQIPWIALALVLVGCAPIMVSSSDMQSGELRGARWGVIKYLNEGAGFVIQGRMDSAKNMMKKYCHKQSFRVLKFEKRIETLDGFPTSFIYIRFECVKPKPEDSYV